VLAFDPSSGRGCAAERIKEVECLLHQRVKMVSDEFY
jgi:hypothetical protein